MKSILTRVFMVVVAVSLLAMPAVSFSKETAQEWEIINPEGTIKLEPMEVNPHPASLEGKTVVLRSNGKHNADNFLQRVAELLEKEVKGIKIVKSWETVPETNTISQNPDKSKEFAKMLVDFKPDLVIASQCD